MARIAMLNKPKTDEQKREAKEAAELLKQEIKDGLRPQAPGGTEKRG